MLSLALGMGYNFRGRHMALDIILIIAGLGVLYAGAEFLVKGSKSFATGIGVKPVVAGLTFVAFGTSMPEFCVSFSSAIRGSTSVAVGNILGSNICNIGLIAGIAAIVCPLTGGTALMKREMPAMLAAALAFQLMSLDGSIGRLDGIILLMGVVLITWLLVRSVRGEAGDGTPDDCARTQARASRGKDLARMAGGVAALAAGSNLMVSGAVSIAAKTGVSELVIGLTIIAIGTSLPELAASVVASARGESEICLGNVIGSNMFNILFVAGLTAIIRPIPVSSDAALHQAPVMLAFSVALAPMLVIKGALTRIEGALLLAAYITYNVWVFLGNPAGAG